MKTKGRKLVQPLPSKASKSATEKQPPDVTCKFCKKEFRAGPRLSESNYNRHLKRYAVKSPQNLKNHPAHGSAEYEAIAKDRGFWTKPETENERLDRKSENSLKWREKHAIESLNRAKNVVNKLLYGGV